MQTTTLIGGGTGPAEGSKATTVTPGSWHLARMLEAMDGMPVNLGLTNTTLQSSQGGAARVQGGCEGDSGGPALVPAGAPQSQQKVVGTTSTGDATSCATNTENTCMRVTSETGPGGFITNYLADDTTGGNPGGDTAMSCGLSTMVPACDNCINTSCCHGHVSTRWYWCTPWWHNSSDTDSWWSWSSCRWCEVASTKHQYRAQGSSYQTCRSQTIGSGIGRSQT